MQFAPKLKKSRLPAKSSPMVEQTEAATAVFPGFDRLRAALSSVPLPASVYLVEDCGDAALRPTRSRVFQRPLADKSNAAMLSQAQGSGLTGQATTDNKYVEIKQDCSRSQCFCFEI